MINKLYINFSFKVLANLVDLTFSGLLFYISGGLVLTTLPMVQVFIGQWVFRLLKELY